MSKCPNVEMTYAVGGPWAGGRTESHAESLVRIFNLLILISVVLTPPFGRFIDLCGIHAGTGGGAGLLTLPGTALPLSHLIFSDTVRLYS